MAAPFNYKIMQLGQKKGEKLISSLQRTTRTDLEAVEICVEDVSTLDVGD